MNFHESTSTRGGFSISYTQDDIYITIGLIVITFFVYLNVSSNVGTLYALMTMTYFIVITSRQIPKIEILSKGMDLPKAFAISAAIFGGWVFLSSTILQYLGAVQSFSLTSYFGALRLFSDVPVLSSDPTVILFIFGFFIPIVETLAVAILIILFSKVFNSQVTTPKIGSAQFRTMLIVALLVGVTMSLFHLTTRVNNPAVTATGQLITPEIAAVLDIIFFGLTAVIVYYSPKIGERSGRVIFILPAIMLHIFSNLGVLLVH